MINLVSLVGRWICKFGIFHLPIIQNSPNYVNPFSAPGQMESQILYFYLPEPLEKLH